MHRSTLQLAKAGIAAAALTISVISCSSGTNTTNTASTPANASTPSVNAASNATSSTPGADLALATELYKTNCAKCHGPDGKGGEVVVDGKKLNPDDLTSAKMKAKTDEKLTKYINDGMPDDGMPAFKDKLSPDEVKTLIAHIRSIQ